MGEREDDYCLPSEAAKPRENDDLRVMAELNNPRIYRDVKHVLREEQRIKLAISRNKSLPFPCNCGQKCEFGTMLLSLHDAVETLFDEYELLHEEYTCIFKAATFVVSGDTVYIKQGVLDSFDSPVGMVAPAKINLSDFALDAGLVDERRRALAMEDMWRKTYELHMECVRMNMLQAARPIQDRFIEWISAHFWGKSKCICYHCDYRDALLCYRRALLSLHLEYLTVYASYYGLISAIHIEEEDIDSKELELLDTDADLVRNVLPDTSSE